MERRELTTAVAEVAYLRGLIAVPIGVLFLLTGLGNLGWAPLQSPWVFGGCLALLAWRLQAYYNDTFGRATQSRQMQVRYAVVTGLLALTLVAGSFLDFELGLPVSLFAASFAVAMLIMFAVQTGLRQHHVLVWGALLVVALVPFWDVFDDAVSVAWLPIGVATIVAGLLDHRLLTARHGARPVLDRQSA